jgi:ABC-type polysaccharide/polyol phosphate transport system ATPase subunit
MLYASLAGLGYRETLNNMDRILEFSGLKNNEFTFVEQLSFGYQQRLFITIMLEAMRLEKASVFMFDEFLVGVDQAFRTRAVEAMESLAKPSQIVIHASHDDDLIRRTCPLTVHVEKGRICQFGPSEQVLQRYRSGPFDV